ncbi:ABC transporter ATP-binding protein [Tepidibacillus sp. HK-1]|uniref:ABC transporter ATP-binding protein n=1 Tax=Tepidibacillus sp. HK-1 TaxID=1883407 RepID=UPI000853ED9D|nr:ABC transporter ATP-binding protein [Tepidibacillus sp. HK-1]GBF10399.1 putative multidrug resistance ABC transporter ATP-binding/permease protein YheI [Tepidibacillus sp. HK-1]
MKHFLTLKDFFIKHKWRYIIGIVWLIAVDVLQLILPKILGAFTDDLKNQSITTKSMILYGLSIIAVAFFMFLFRYLWRMYVMGTARFLEYKLRSDLFAHFQKLSTNYYNHHKVGDLMAHATNDINAVRMAAGPGIVMIFDTLVLLSATIFMMVQTISVKLTIIALLPLPFMALLTSHFGKLIHQRFRKAQESFSHLTENVQENVSGIRVIKAFVQEQEEIKKFTHANQDYVDKNMELVRIQAIFNPLVQFISGLSFLIVLAYGGILVINRQITLGDFVAFNSYLGLLTWPIMAIGWVINILQRGSASMSRLNEIFATEPEIVDHPQLVDPDLTTIQGEIEFNHLSFTYPGTTKEVLSDINIRIPQGKTLAIVGKTGSGKTTLVNLLVRLYDVSTGMIKIDGRDIKSYPLEVLRQHIGYVPQDNFLFSTTIRENIGFGLDHYTQEQVEKAADDAQVLDNIKDFPAQFDTLLGERGVTLSGGQKQRVSIARALIKNPSILILDDSLSAVDTKTEEAILKRLHELMKNRTSIIIAHRISTLKEADEIIVLDEGKIVERGTHGHLMELQGHYYDLYQKQLLEEMIANQI